MKKLKLSKTAQKNLFVIIVGMELQIQKLEQRVAALEKLGSLMEPFGSKRTLC